MKDYRFEINLETNLIQVLSFSFNETFPFVVATYKITDDPNVYGLELVSGSLDRQVYDRLYLWFKINRDARKGINYFWNSEFDRMFV